ncbi:MAG: methylenetetrahydrofolate reductase [NAD(P)H] [Chloroflexi bacterium]|nr:methylenetetrahydrofolate reductase [NAD(P)H] [Chloroflexota bacterium]
MKIREILKNRRTLSFEFFPPKTEKGIKSVFETIETLKTFRPDFVSVTHGAGGTTRALTVEIALRIKRENGLLVMAHMTCIGQSKEEIHSVLLRLEDSGIENVIALRGDPPREQTSSAPVKGDFAHATDLIEHIKSNFEFGLAAACYPEGHPESTDLASDIEYAKRKVDLGAEFLITQLFFDNSDFYRFLDSARKAGINVPILAGILPILSTSQIRRFTALCGATIPENLDKRLDRFADDNDAVREIGVEHATTQVDDLLASGVQGVHFYALNKGYSISKIIDNINRSSWSTQASPLPTHSS